MGLEGKVALITGGARGIGRGVAERYLAAGARVVIAARTASDVEGTVAELSASGDVAGVPCDVSDEGAVRALVEGVVARFSALDVLVCSHGIYHGESSVLDYPVELWDRTIAVNLRGTFLCGQAAARAMVARGDGGRLINISSTAGLASVPGESAYDASKGGVHALTRAMALDLAPHGITVNAIAPGWIVTPMVPEDKLRDLVGHINPMRRFGGPQDVADAAAWLADSATAYVTGSTIVVDGGQHASLGFANIDSP